MPNQILLRRVIDGITESDAAVAVSATAGVGAN